jgi:hypothetical protein
MHSSRTHTRAILTWCGLLFGMVALIVLGGARSTAAAPIAKPLPPKQPANPLTEQIIPGFPLSMTVEDNGRMQIRYRDYGDQFFGGDAEGAYLWANVAGTTTVFGPGHVPAGRDTNEYTPVSNQLSGTGTAVDPWVVTTVNNVPGTNLRLTQSAAYVNGAEFVSLFFNVAQVGGSTPVTVTLFHAADLYTAGNDSGYGYYDPASGGIGDYFTPTTGSLAGSTVFQQFVPNANTPASAYMESYYSTIWQRIGDLSGPGGGGPAGFDNTYISDPTNQHDSGAGLQWNLTIQPNSSVTVGDRDLFSPLASICGSFSDVPYGSYYYTYVSYLACNGIVSGYSDTTFRPDNNTSRGQIAKIASNSAGFTETVTTQTFEDVGPSNPFYPFIERMASRGLISGYTCGGPNEPCVAQGNRPYFRWGAPVTRGQLAKILANAKGLNNTIPPTQQTFNDVPAANPFWLYIERLYSQNGVISGYSCGGVGEPCPGLYFRWGNNATRGQIAKIDKILFFGP